jgi:regulator of sigma D
MTTSRRGEAAQPPPHKAQDRRRSSRDLLKKLVAERTEMLVLYCRLAGLESYSENPGKDSSRKLLQQFCQLLVDYIAAGHFSLYERIVNATERRRDVANLAEELYPRISETTEAALDFNDKYDCGDHCDITASFSDDLSRLGEKLASRIELEDRLLKLLS